MINIQSPRYFLIQTFMKQKQWEKAFSISEIENSSPNLKYLQGICFLRIGKHEPALEISETYTKTTAITKMHCWELLRPSA